MTVSATEATFEGFRVTRQNPRAILIWTAVWLIGLILATLATLPLIGPWTSELTAANGDAAKLSPAAIAGLSRAMLAVVPVILVLEGLLAPAVYRAVLTPSAKRFGYLRLGRDELRVFLVFVGLAAISLTFNYLSAGLETLAGKALGMLGAGLVSMVMFAVSVVITVRLSMVAPLTLLRGRIAFKEGWQVSRGWFWPLLGITILSLTMAAIVVILLILIGWPLQAVVVTAAGAVSPLAVVSSLVVLLLLPLGAALVTTILWAPFAAMCRNLPPQT